MGTGLRFGLKLVGTGLGEGGTIRSLTESSTEKEGRGGVGKGNNDVEGVEDGRGVGGSEGEVGSSRVDGAGGDGGSMSARLSSTSTRLGAAGAPPLLVPPNCLKKRFEVRCGVPRC